MTRYGFRYGDNHYLSGTRPYVVLRHRFLSPEIPEAPGYKRKMEDIIQGFCSSPPSYDYFEVLNQALKLILSRGEQFTRSSDYLLTMNLLFLTAEKMMCSALVDTVYERAGIDLFPGRATRHTTPADIASLCSGDNPSLVEVFKSYSHPANGSIRE